MSNNLRKRAPLPWWQRFLFGMALPILAYYGAYVLFQERVHAVLQAHGVPAARPAAKGDVAQILGAYAPLLAIVMSLPLWFFVLVSTLRPWKHWYTAIIGGILAIAAGLICNWTVTLLITQLLR